MNPEVERLREEGAKLYKKAAELRAQGENLYIQASKLERQEWAASLEVGMKTQLVSYPMDWLFQRIVGPDTMLVIDKLGPKNATVSNADGSEFQFPKRKYRRLLVPRTDLQPLAV